MSMIHAATTRIVAGALMCSGLVGAIASGALALQSDPALAQAKARDRRLLLLQAGEFDPAQGLPSLPPGYAWRDDERAARDYFIVQLRAVPTAADRAAIAQAGARLFEYLPHDAFFAQADVAALPRMRALAQVRAIVPFEPAFRVDPDLIERARAERTLALAMILFPGSDTAGASERVLELGGELLEWDAADRERMRVRVPASALPELARIRDVQWIQADAVPATRNGTTKWVIQSNVSGSTPIWDHAILGDGTILGHIDEPLDLNSCYFIDPIDNNPGPNHRKVVSFHGSSGSPGAHGTHTAGTLAGDQEPITGVIDRNGMGYHARIAHTNLSLITSTNLASELTTLYGDGGRLFTNSWGDDSTTKYNQWCHDIDQVSRDNWDALICFAETDTTKLKNPENAKNLIAIGASGQDPNQENVCFGGVGPTSDGRRKPEVFAPGCGIFSAKRNVSCSTTSMDGTSMACPAVVGAASLALQYFRDGWYPSGAPNSSDGFMPSGALIKAVVIDSSVDMTGVSGYPSDQEGWGRLLLHRGLYFTGDTRKLFAVDVAESSGFSATGQSQTFFFEVLGNGEPLEICMVFMDEPAAVNASFAAVNDLNLEVVAPDGSLYRGNVFSSGHSTIGGSADAINNVERVKLDVPLLGRYTLTVKSAIVVGPRSQGFALVASGDLDPPHKGSFTSYGSGLAGSGGYVPSLTGSGAPQIGGALTFSVDTGLGGAAGLLFIGFSRAGFNFAGGTLLVAPPWLPLPIALGGGAGVPGAGELDLSGTLPNDPSLEDLVLDLQGAFADPGAARGISLTPGLELSIGA